MADPTIDYDEVQGTILRGYRVNLARHFIFSITDAAQARRTIAALLDGSDGLPSITTARHIHPKPPCFLNLSFTAPGLSALGVNAADLTTFDPAFQRGATDPLSIAAVGDVGASAPAHWLGNLGPATENEQVHALLSLWVSESEEVLQATSAKLRSAFAAGWRELYAHDGVALPDNRVHFGYRDSIAQPDIDGAPQRKHEHDPDPLNSVMTGEFLLGYQNENGGTYQVQPPQLSTNGSYAAFRILEQDVPLFDSILRQGAASSGLTTEMVAAKMCGRWRNGNPLVLSPDEAGPALPDASLNRFHYVDGQPELDDTLGLKCPIGSHIRRNNPRDEAVVGASARHHRIVRRAMPYGSEYDPAAPIAAQRGLVGYFINASLRNQFEFLMKQWNNDDTFVKSAVGPAGPEAGNATLNISGQDVFLGINDPAVSSFTLPGVGAKGSGNTKLQHFSRSVITRGGVYCFFPSITGLRYLANLG
ncbi:Dyp-type peroxidase [Janthinobacterium sp. LB3P112]|uniref:Dyp-type peroxidase n=1 Tax=Janthinobacterium sp. LB3P112 TaxID=3424196 RepID=UPI003F27E15B